MIIYLLVRIVNFIANLLVFCIILDSILSFFTSPTHPFRSLLGKLVQPLLKPIRRVVPLVGNFDLSPLVLIVLIEIVAYLISKILYSL